MAEVTIEEVQRAVQTEIRKAGNPNKALVALIKRDAKHRDRIRELDTENKTLREKAPADGTVVLDAEAAKRWQAYEALGKKPEEIKTALDEGEKAVGKLADLQWSDQARRAAEIAGFENPEAFLALPSVRDLTIEIKTEKVDGQDVERAYVKQGSETKLLDMTYVDSRTDWKALKGALGAIGASDRAAGGPEYRRDRPESRPGTKPTDEVFRKATESTVHYVI